MNRFNCAQCSNLLQYPDELAGKKIRCPQCKNIVQLPLTAAAPSSKPTAKPSGSSAPTPALSPERLSALEAAKQAAKKKAAAEKLAQQKAAQQKAAQQKAAQQKSAQQKATNQQAAQQKPANQKAAQQRAAQQKAAQQKKAAQPAASGPKAAPMATPVKSSPSTNPYAQPLAPIGELEELVEVEPLTAQPIQAQPIQATPIQATPIQATPIQATPIGDPFQGAQPLGQPMMQPGGMQPGMAQPMGYQQPAWQQPARRKKGSGKALKRGLIWGGAGAGVVTLVILLLVFRPWEAFSGPKAVFNKVRSAMLNGNYIVLYDVSSNKGRESLERMVDMATNFDPTGKFSDLKGMEGRAKVKKFFAMAEELQQQRGFKISEDQKAKLRESKVTKVEYSDDGQKATLTVEAPGEDPTTLVVVKEDGTWRMGGPGGPRRLGF